MFRVSGWSGPSTRSWSVRSLFEGGGGAGRVAGLPPPVGEVAAGGQGVGVVGAEPARRLTRELSKVASCGRDEAGLAETAPGAEQQEVCVGFPQSVLGMLAQRVGVGP